MLRRGVWEIAKRWSVLYPAITLAEGRRSRDDRTNPTSMPHPTLLPLATSIHLALCMLSSAVEVDVYLAAGQSNATPTWANSIQAGLRAAAGSPNVLVFRSEHAGNALWQWYNNGTPGNNYTDDLAVLRQGLASVEANGDTPVFKGIFWMQGEGDTSNPTNFSLYPVRFNAMLARYQADLGLEEPPNFALGIIDANPAALYDDPAQLGTTRENVEALRSALAALGQQSNGTAVDSRSKIRIDAWHIDGTGQITLGREMASAFLAKFANPEPQVPLRVISIDHSGNSVTLKWASVANHEYTIYASDSLEGDPEADWDAIGTDIPSGGDVTTFTDLLAEPAPARRFYRVFEANIGG